MMNRLQILELKSSGFSAAALDMQFGIEPARGFERIDNPISLSANGRNGHNRQQPGASTSYHVGGLHTKAVKHAQEYPAAKEQCEPAEKTVGYLNSTEIVYEQTAIRFLIASGLDFLSACEGYRQSSTMPSWVPDWQVPTKKTMLAYLPLSGFRAGLARTSFEIPYEHQWTIVRKDQESQGALEVQAVNLGLIQKLGDICDSDRADWLSIIFDHWMQIVLENGKSAKSITWPAFKRFLDVVLMDCSNDFLLTVGKIFSRLTTSEENHTQLPELDNKIRHRLRVGCHQRRIFISEAGFIGLAPDNAQVGDEIEVFCGASVPFVVRPCLEYCNLIGDCFVGGYMKGEAFDRVEDDFMPRRLDIR
jgi:hypothetical protein